MSGDAFQGAGRRGEAQVEVAALGAELAKRAHRHLVQRLAALLSHRHASARSRPPPASPLAAELQPAQLVVLQAVARSLDLDHPVATLRRPELDQVRQAGAVARDILQQAFEPGAQVGRRQAIERLFEQFLAKQLPVDEGRLQAELVAVATADRVAVAAVLQPPQAGLEQGGAALAEVGAVQVRRRAVEGMEERPGMAAKIASQQNSPNSELIRPFST